MSNCSPSIIPATAAISCAVEPAATVNSVSDRDVKSNQSISTLALPITGETSYEISKVERAVLIKKMHLDLSAVEANVDEEKDEDGYYPRTPDAKLLHRKKARLVHRIGGTCTHLKIVLLSVLFLFLVAVALLVVCIVAASES